MRYSALTTLAVAALSGLAACHATDDGGLWPITPRQFEQLEGTEPSARLEDFAVQQTRFMLYGVERATSDEPLAVIANKRSGETQSYRVGDLLARNWRVAGIDEHGVELRNYDRYRYLTSGARFELSTITHTLDRAVVKAGHHLWRLQPAVLGDEVAGYGLGAELEVLTHPDPSSDLRAIEVVSVAPRGLFAQLRLEPRDVIAWVNRAPLRGDTVLADLVERLTSDTTSAVVLGISRYGHLIEERYQTAGEL